MFVLCMANDSFHLHTVHFSPYSAAHATYAFLLQMHTSAWNSLSIHESLLDLFRKVGAPSLFFCLRCWPQLQVMYDPNSIFPTANLSYGVLGSNSHCSNNRKNTNTCAIVFQKRPYPQCYLCWLAWSAGNSKGMRSISIYVCSYCSFPFLFQLYEAYYVNFFLFNRPCDHFLHACLNKFIFSLHSLNRLFSGYWCHVSAPVWIGWLHIFHWFTFFINLPFFFLKCKGAVPSFVLFQIFDLHLNWAATTFKQTPAEFES